MSHTKGSECGWTQFFPQFSFDYVGRQYLARRHSIAFSAYSEAV
jgi:hypothetical protein